MSKQTLPETAAPSLRLGDEAVAMGAIDAGITAAYAYPGTPSTEIMETLIHLTRRGDGGPKASWATNEKTAYEQALGVAMAGRRALVSMKHVGLNVAADPFMSSALVEVHGGLVIAVADDPGMHSSQNEQDSRFFADFARIPCLEPADPQQCYEMTREAFDLSERFRTPVMLRLVTRLAHGRGLVRPAPARAENPITRAQDPRSWVLLPSNSRRLWGRLLDQQPQMQEWSEGHDAGGWVSRGEDGAPYGVITTGVAKNHYLEVSPELGRELPHVHIGTYPFPRAAIDELARRTGRILVLEEGQLFVERLLKGAFPGVEVLGRLTGEVVSQGELNPDRVRAALGLKVKPKPPSDLPARPPRLCDGCPHRDSYAALNEAIRSLDTSVVTADIGCYTLGALPPYQSIESCVCMGASVGMAKGASDAGLRPAVGVIGDSTFLHSGITPLIDCVADQSSMTLLILDNEGVAMTGGQPTMLNAERIERVVLGVGIEREHCRVLVAHPRKVEEIAGVLREEFEYEGPSVVILTRECIQLPKARKKESKAHEV